MHRSFETLANELFHNPEFRISQNKIALSACDTLSKSYKNGDGEIEMVRKLCETLNNKECGKAKIYAAKIHGKRSIVEFYNDSNEQVSRELADMAVISLVTHKHQVIFEKIAFIQNKKEKTKCTNKWDIEQDQLFLLHNLPTFDGVEGIFGGKKDITLPNIFGQLGNYGLFRSNGDMVFANAKIINAFQEGTTISFDRIRSETAKNNLFNSANLIYYPEFHEELYYLLKHNLTLPILAGLPIFGTCDIALNLYQFIRNWTQLNIGESAVIKGKCINGILSKLINYLLERPELNVKDSSLKGHFDFSRIESNEEHKWNFEFGGAVFIFHYDIDNTRD